MLTLNRITNKIVFVFVLTLFIVTSIMTINTKAFALEDCSKLVTNNTVYATSHPDTVLLQDCLKRTGDFTYQTSTGYFGNLTKTALDSFKLKMNPVVVTPKPTDPKNPFGNPTSSKALPSKNCNLLLTANTMYGIDHSDVAKLQQCLKDTGYLVYQGSLGYYGLLTNDAMKRHIVDLNYPITNADCENTNSMKALVFRRSDNRYFECQSNIYTGWNDFALSYGLRPSTPSCIRCVETKPGRFLMTYTQTNRVWEIGDDVNNLTCVKIEAAITFNGDQSMHNIVAEKGPKIGNTCQMQKLSETLLGTSGCIASNLSTINRIRDRFQTGEGDEAANDFIIK